jgi:hypothetical protein
MGRSASAAEIHAVHCLRHGAMRAKSIGFIWRHTNALIKILNPHVMSPFQNAGEPFRQSFYLSNTSAQVYIA